MAIEKREKRMEKRSRNYKITNDSKKRKEKSSKIDIREKINLSRNKDLTI